MPFSIYKPYRGFTLPLIISLLYPTHSLAQNAPPLQQFIIKSEIKNEIQSPELFHSINIVFGDPNTAQSSLDWVIKRNNKDLAAHLITAMRYSSLGRDTISLALNQITGETDRKDWFEWMLWQQRNNDIAPHHSYLSFKSEVFYSIDPTFNRFFKPNSSFDIRPEEIVWGGVRVDGIPALDNPKHISAKEATYLNDDDEIFGIEINGDIRAYPLRIMGWHEMFNDVIGDVPISLAYCTLCGAGIAFEGDVKGREIYGVKEPFTFGSSGFLYQSNKLMYDRNTDSLWNQFTGEPVSGALKDSGISLKIRPVVITNWGEWKKLHPTTKVLSLKTGFRRNYGSGVVYRDYFSSPNLMFPALGDESRKLAEKDQIFGLRLEGGIKAWPLNSFKNGKIINDKVGAINVVLIGDKNTRTIRAYERNDFVFTPELKTTDGQNWTLSENHLVSSKGGTLKRLPGHISYWFAWAGYLGDETELYKH
jgi:hypothetical protein